MHALILPVRPLSNPTNHPHSTTKTERAARTTKLTLVGERCDSNCTRQGTATAFSIQPQDIVTLVSLCHRLSLRDGITCPVTPTFSASPRGFYQAVTMPSPTKETIPSLPPAMMTTTLQPPPSPNTHRLRKLQSAHNLGAKASFTGTPSLISQQRLQQQQQQQHSQHHPLQRSGSPVRRNISTSNRSPQRGRANSDAAMANPFGTMMTPARRNLFNNRNHQADGMSLERLIRDGPVDGDVMGSLESARLKILNQGIKSDGDGMVSLSLALALPATSLLTHRLSSLLFVSTSGLSFSILRY